MPTCLNCEAEVHPSAQSCVRCGSLVEGVSETSIAVPANGGAGVIPTDRPEFSSAPLFSYRKDLSGIGGWLIYFAFGLVASPVLVFLSSLRSLRALMNPAAATFLQLHKMLSALLVFEVITNAIFVLILIALIVLFFRKMRAFPTYMILYLGFHLAAILADTLVTHAIATSIGLHVGNYKGVFQSFVGCCIWIPYLLKSERVKQTFVE